ncbi:MAG: winged helix-turn-helix transcriptional regulator [Candidatus Kariarchaeaceae archaeon]
MKKLPSSALKVIKILAEQGILIQKELMIHTGLPAKTIRYAINRLTKDDIVIKIPNFDDMRSPKLSLNPDFNADQFFEEIKRPIEVKL